MYATCLHCHHALGGNEAVEQFPIGRRLAFDAAKGRLWVICPACQRWNLTPIEERWEAVESCERLFRGQRLRSQTDNIGLTRISEGTELIRIGSPLRPEFAAWRYGRVFSARLHRQVGLAAGVGAAVGVAAYSLSASAIMASVGAFLPIGFPVLVNAGVFLSRMRQLRSVRVIGDDGKPLRVKRANLDHTRIEPSDDGPLHLHLRHRDGNQELHGDRAARVLATLLAHINRRGAGIGTTGQAASVIMWAGDPARAIANIAREARRREGDFEEYAAVLAVPARTMDEFVRRRHSRGLPFFWPDAAMASNPGALHRLPRVQRLALEMALHEISEQHALEEEIETLERAWREAEEIAAIADDLLVPPSIEQRINKR